MRLKSLLAFVICSVGTAEAALPKIDGAALIQQSKNVVRVCSLALQNTGSLIVHGPADRKEFHNLGKILTNQTALKESEVAATSSIIFRNAFKELAPGEAEHFELVYWLGTDPLYVEGKPWPVRFKPGTALFVRRGTWLVVGYMTDEYVDRTRRWALVRMSQDANRKFKHAH